MTVTYTYTRDWHDDGTTRTAIVYVRTVAADATNRPVHDNVALVAWDRDGHHYIDFGDHTRRCGDRTVNLDDWANPDDYWADGKLWTWHTDLVARFGPAAVACLVSLAPDKLVMHPAWSLATVDATARAVDAHGAVAVGCAVIGPTTVADPADWYPHVAVCGDTLHLALGKTSAWCHDHVYEIVARVDGGDETIVHVGYGDDLDWAATQARLHGDRLAANGRERP